ncbi:uncharacterized protein BKA55DRAFT_575753 [Fusarium redolens]|uniref:Uncharacterized protein n=1 Tax=Fusarium redolens TaxID=48865 RepID=A0A9P9GKE7_FUSRE|nr:uncharacterized protein BKA55DRAFT_575753 [Fusarium redolens]KAH7240781.1 hypothetical protein BKA55DRAFT_575753 [Fusarium redolens]
MHLSFSSDRLAAIQGIAGLLSKRHGVDCFASVFRSQCAEHLLWRSEDPQSSPDTSDNFPTWSWVSSKGAIDFMTVALGAWGSWMENLEPFPSSWQEKGLARIANKKLCFLAPLLRLDMLGPEDADSEDTEPRPGLHCILLGPGSPVELRRTCNLFLDSLASSASLKRRAFLLFLRCRFYDTTPHEGLVVQMVEGDCKRSLQVVEKSYQRVGYFCIDQVGHRLDKAPDLKEWVAKVVLV